MRTAWNASPVSRRTRPALGLPALALAGALLLTGCGPSGPQTAPQAVIGDGGAETIGTATIGAGTTEAESIDTESIDTEVTVTDPWAKATGEGMTGVFATIENASGQDLTLTGASTELATTVELHETVDDGTGATVMQEVEGGFTIPAGGSLELAPGGNHIMLMGLHQQIAPGDVVEVQLEFEGGRTQVLTAPAKEFAGAQENYGGAGEMDHGGEDMSPADQDHGGH
jgi:copper(I)-binding protein